MIKKEWDENDLEIGTLLYQGSGAAYIIKDIRDNRYDIIQINELGKEYGGIVTKCTLSLLEEHFVKIKLAFTTWKNRYTAP